MNLPNSAATRAKLEGQPLLAPEISGQKHISGPVQFEGRLSINDDKYMGAEIPRRLANGPVQNRRLTDIFCCIIFTLAFLAFVIIGIIFGAKGDGLNYDQLLDSEGQSCGVDPVVKDFPYLYMIKFSKNYRSVCVKECLKFDYNQIKYNSSGLNTTYIQPVYYENLSAVIDYSVRNDIGAESTDNPFDYDEAAAAGYYSKQQWDTYLSNRQLVCMPNLDVKSCRQNEPDGVYLYDSRESFNGFCTPITPRAAAAVSLVGDINGNWTRDIKISKWMILISILLAFILSLAFLYLSSFIMSFIIWLQLGIAILFLLALSIVLWLLAFGDHSDMLLNNNASAATIRAYKSLRNHRVVVVNFSGLSSCLH